MDIHGVQKLQSGLLRIIAEGAGVADIAEALTKVIDAPVIVTNEFHKIIASTHEAYPRHSFIRSNQIERSNNPGLCRINLGSNINEAYSFPSYIKNETLGFLYIIEEKADSDSTTIQRVGEAASLVFAVQLAKEKEFSLSEKRYIDAFLFDLLYGNMESGKDIISRGELWGWDLSQPQCVLVFEFDDYDYFSGDKELIEVLFDSVQSVMNELGEKPVLTKKKGEVIAILFKSKDSYQEQSDYTKLLTDKVKNLVQTRIPSRTLRLGIGRIYKNPKEIFRSYQEAKVALELGKLMDSRLRTPFFDKLGVTKILYNHDRQELAELYKETLGDLERYDLVQKTDLLKTLETFLANRCDLKETAKVSYVHPNTLRYRLKKIEEILAINLDDFDTKLDLMVAFKIKYLKASEIEK
ncbi:PucR family transcriptional regulator [Desulfosporosinus meridiei]|uniref:Sugar diacid utilization regulator n=1 Tax=Desulfosporosinus meridiei (strain ATCC BAA-275 / DSM 13257 / KCTC 12902 / NCIMB 13706 / S10) TaxID=768704 RepID=J7IWG5_DESMD|nr:helix-turn-helix domain-containing protein [Desulfosporosinus meridiei]AFQ43448.1 sugar diacid utilization regulator [Desulfosporosinus meridiei DSM 13257]